MLVPVLYTDNITNKTTMAFQWSSTSTSFWNEHFLNHIFSYNGKETDWDPYFGAESFPTQALKLYKFNLAWLSVQSMIYYRRQLSKIQKTERKEEFAACKGVYTKKGKDYSLAIKIKQVSCSAVWFYWPFPQNQCVLSWNHVQL